MIEVTIPLRSQEEAIQVLGAYDRHAKLLRQTLDIDIFTSGGNLRLKGEEESVDEARQRVEHLLGKLRKGREIEPDEVEAILSGSRSNGPTSANKHEPRSAGSSDAPKTRSASRERPVLFRRPKAVVPRGRNQRKYMDLMEKHSLVFSVGPAGTGKTFLAIAAALNALRRGECRRIVLTRPVVEAGEHLGFLPGDMQAKLNPYLRPVYDALTNLLDFEEVARLEELGVIEIAPLAYMRGRTLSHAFAILDEAQNTTIGQMKMFLTRLGERSRMVVTGDPSQTDLESGQRSGLADAVGRLRSFEGIGAVEFETQDIVRHPLVEQIVRAYESPSKIERHDGDE